MFSCHAHALCSSNARPQTALNNGRFREAGLCGTQDGPQPAQLHARPRPTPPTPSTPPLRVHLWKYTFACSHPAPAVGARSASPELSPSPSKPAPCWPRSPWVHLSAQLRQCAFILPAARPSSSTPFTAPPHPESLLLPPPAPLACMDCTATAWIPR